MKKVRLATLASQLGIYLTLAQNVLAQTASPATLPATGGGGATSSALPSAGTTELTYLIFIAGVALFVFGMMKLVASFRE